MFSFLHRVVDQSQLDTNDNYNTFGRFPSKKIPIVWVLPKVFGDTHIKIEFELLK